MNKLLSIIIPTYNMETLLDQCLMSLILPDAKKREQLDVIVVIDGANDRSSEIAHGYESRYPETFRVLDKKNGNYGSCINAALPWVLKDGGKYVRILDADDSYETVNLCDFLDILANYSVDLVVSPNKTVNEKGKLTMYRSYSLPENKIFSISEVPLEGIIPMHSVAFRSSIFSEIEYHQTEGISYTDVEWAVAPMQRVQTVFYFNKPIYRYLLGREGQTMDNLTILRKLGDEVKSLFAQLKTLASVAEGNPAKPWMQHMIDQRVKRIYGLGLDKQAAIDLNEFDKNLLKEYPAAYERALNFTMPVGFFNLHMHFVKMWRRVRCRKGMRLYPKYLLFIIASRLNKV